MIDMSMKQPFLELNRILEALRMQDLRPALEYVLFPTQTDLFLLLSYVSDIQKTYGRF